MTKYHFSEIGGIQRQSAGGVQDEDLYELRELPHKHWQSSRSKHHEDQRHEDQEQHDQGNSSPAVGTGQLLEAKEGGDRKVAGGAVQVEVCYG